MSHAEDGNKRVERFEFAAARNTAVFVCLECVVADDLTLNGFRIFARTGLPSGITSGTRGEGTTTAKTSS